MIKSNFLAVVVIIFVRQSFASLPHYVHLHSWQETLETNYVVLNKLDVCKDSEVIIGRPLIAIKTSPNNGYQRDAVRQSWLTDARKYHVPYIFVLGFTTNEHLLSQLLKEDEKYHDLLIGKPVDDYYNLTLKSMFILSWARAYCSSRWLLYIDDDTLVNVQNVIDFVNSVYNRTDRVLYCRICRLPVIRNPQSKWFVPESKWKPAYYPDYCHGWAYLIPPTVISLLHQASNSNFTKPKLWIEDVFITGIVAKAVGLKLIETNIQCCGRGGHDLFGKNLVLAEMGKGKQLLDNWIFIKRVMGIERKVDSTTVISIKNVSQFDVKGYILAPTIQNNETSRNYTVAKSYNLAVQSSLCFTIIFVVIVALLLHDRIIKQALKRTYRRRYFKW